jgi:hypothetical protein
LRLPLALAEGFLLFLLKQWILHRVIFQSVSDVVRGYFCLEVLREAHGTEGVAKASEDKFFISILNIYLE